MLLWMIGVLWQIGTHQVSVICFEGGNVVMIVMVIVMVMMTVVMS